MPEWKREPPKLDLNKMDPKDPEGMLKMSKKGRTLMLFATVSGWLPLSALVQARWRYMHFFSAWAFRFSQGINESTNFLPAETSVIFGFRRDCP